MSDSNIKLQQSNSINAKVELALVENVYKQATLGFIISVICATMVLIFLWYVTPQNSFIFLWYLIFTIIALIRLMLVNKFLHMSHDKIHTKLWQNLFTLGTILSGIIWGFTGTSLLLPTGNPFEQTTILVILAGITAGAVPLNSYVREAAILFIVFALLPLIIHFMDIFNMIYLLFDITIIVFTISLIILSFKTHKILRHSLYLHFENDELLIELTDAKKQLEITNKRLQQAATHDPLTHVANRHLFEAILQDAINRAEQDKHKLALLYLDLDKFKEVNDTYGHHAGDQLLLVIIARIKNILRDSDTVARLGGDEITIILENATHFETITEIADRICQAIAKPIKIDTIEVQVYASIGISIYPTDGLDIKKLIEVADKAMYFVKENGGNSFHFNLDSK